MKLLLALTAALALQFAGGVRTHAELEADQKADQIIQKVKERSVEADAQKRSFAYQRVSRVEYLDENGAVKKNAIRVYDVVTVDGKPVSRLVQIDGRLPTDKDEAHRSSARETGDKSRGLELNEDLLSRFEYRLRGETVEVGRRVWLLDFAPKSGVESDGFFDRLINSMRGTLWVDQEDYQFAKVDVHLSKKVSFFGGIAGAIEKMDLQIIQKRVDPAVWLSEGLTLDFSGRKLFSSIRFRCFENCSGFREVLNGK